MSRSARRALSDVRAPTWLPIAILWLLLTLAAAVVLWLGVQVLARLIVVTTAVVAALLLTALLQPAVDRLDRTGLPRWLASLLALLATLAALIGFFYLLVARIMDQASDLRQAIVGSGERLRSLVLESPLPVTADELDQLPEQALDALERALPAPATGAALAVDVFATVVLALFLWFFFLKDGAAMWRWFLSWVPSRRRARWDRSGSLAWFVIGRYVRGTVVIAFADAVGIGLAMAFLGNPLTVSLSLLVFLGAFVPIVGSVVAGTVAVLVTLVTVGFVEALILLGAVILVQQLEGNLLQPLVMGKALHLHPVVIVVAVTAGTLVAGVLGALVAVPVLAVLYRIADDMRERPAQPSPDPPDRSHTRERSGTAASRARPRTS